MAIRLGIVLRLDERYGIESYRRYPQRAVPLPDRRVIIRACVRV